MKQIKRWFSQEEGFTLIEISIVLLVIAMLTILILPNVSGVTDNVTNSTEKTVVETVNTQLMIYKSNNPDKSDASPEALALEGYITKGQLDAYNAAKKDGQE